MSGNWLRTSAIGFCLALFTPQALWAQRAATLDTVVVTATRTEEKLREVTSNVTVITEEAIQRSSASDLTDLLGQHGFDVVGGNPGYGMTQIVLRGMRSSIVGDTSDISGADTLVLINGRRTGGPSPTFFGLANVERIEIIRGPAATQFGPAATAGVVNIITKRGGEKPNVRAEIGAGSYDQSRLKLNASGQSANGVVDFAFGAGYRYQGDYKTGAGWVWEGTRAGSQYSFNADVGLNLPGGHRFGVNYNYFARVGAEFPSLTAGNYISHNNPVPLPFAGLNSSDAVTSNIAFSYTGSTEDKAFNWQGAFNFAHNERKSQSLRANGTWGAVSERGMDTRHLSAGLGYDKGGLFALSGGLEYLLYDVTPTDNTRPKYKDFGAFLTGKLRLLDDSLIFSAGGRFDAYDVIRGDDSLSKTNFAPSIGLAWLPVDWLKVRGNYSHGFKMPSPSHLWPNPAWYDVAPDLSPEYSKTWEVGLDVNVDFFSASLTYFNTSWKDQIASVQTSPSRWLYKNLQKSAISGYELALSVDLGRAFQQDFVLRPYVNLTYMPTMRCVDPDFYPEKPGDTLVYTSKMTMSYGLEFVEPNIDLMAKINARYAGKKLVHDRDRDPNGSVWMHYAPGTVVDMAAEKGILEFADMGTLKVRAEVNNLFDRYYAPHPNYPGPGRNFYVGMVYDY